MPITPGDESEEVEEALGGGGGGGGGGGQSRDRGWSVNPLVQSSIANSGSTSQQSNRNSTEVELNVVDGLASSSSPSFSGGQKGKPHGTHSQVEEEMEHKIEQLRSLLAQERAVRAELEKQLAEEKLKREALEARTRERESS